MYNTLHIAMALQIQTNKNQFETDTKIYTTVDAHQQSQFEIDTKNIMLDKPQLDKFSVRNKFT